jgi:cytochrome c oxidase subunit 2
VENKGGREFIWIASVVVVLAIFLGSIAYALRLGYSVASEVSVMPLEKAAGLFQPGVKDLGDGRYQVDIIAFLWGFRPARVELNNPREIILRIYSNDVIHGIQIVGTNVNVMVIPGYIATVIWRPPQNINGTLLVICNEYCGIGHSGMYMEIVIKR